MSREGSSRRGGELTGGEQGAGGGAGEGAVSVTVWEGNGCTARAKSLKLPRALKLPRDVRAKNTARSPARPRAR
jgi:hypothetical protein